MDRPPLDSFVEASTSSSKPSLDSFVSQPQTSSIPEQSLSNKIWGGLATAGNIANAVFPGKQVGQSIGTLAGLGIEKAKGLLGGKDNSKNYDLTSPSPIQVAGDVAQGALTVVAPSVGQEATALGRIGANTALGAGLGASNSIAQGKTLSENIKDTALGGTIGAGASIAGEGLKTLTDNLPKWLTKLALPKIDNKNIPYALENTKVGTISTLQKQSNSSLKTYEDNIQSILSHPEFKTVAADSESIINDAVNKFPNSNYTAKDLIENANSLAPKVGKLLQKFEAGQADIQEINTIRKELDAATKSVYTTLNRPPESKILGATLSNAMREYVQTTAPETQGIFSKYAQEIGLKKALDVAVKKGEQKVKLGDIAAGVGGFSHSGFKGALEAIIAERLLLNPSAQLIGAKALNTATKLTPLAQGLKAPIIKKITDSNP